MTDHSEPHRHLRRTAYGRPLPTLDPLIPLVDMVAGIEAVRMTSSVCQACGGAVDLRGLTRVCYCCRERLPLEAFHRKHDEKHGRDYLCKDCKRTHAKVTDAARYARKKREQFRKLLGRTT